MDEQKLLLSFLLEKLSSVRSSADIERVSWVKRYSTPIVISLCVLMAAILGGTVVYTFPDILHEFTHQDWSNLGFDVGILLMIPFTFIQMIRNLKKDTDEKPSLEEYILGLRERLSDELLIPPIEEQPLPLEVERLPRQQIRLGPVRRWKSDMVAAIILIFLFLLPIDVFLVLLVIAAFSPGLLAPIILSAMALSMIGASVLVCIAIWRRFRSRLVTVNERGLHWEHPGVVLGKSKKVVDLAWHEINGFYEIRGQHASDRWKKAYVLDSPKGTFYWPVYKRSRSQERETSTYLLSLIKAYTHLPLRNLTGAIAPLLSIPSAAGKTENAETQDIAGEEQAEILLFMEQQQ